jgi:protein O-GlcNAc transferase
MPVSIPDALKMALQHHRAGRFEQARDIYRRILAVEPKNADALHLLGVIAHQNGKSLAAVDLISRAIALNPSVPMFHNNIGEACRALNRFDEAEAHYRHALVLDPGFAEAHASLGALLRDDGKRDEALDHYSRAIALKPGYVSARLGHVVTQLPPVYASAEDVAESRERYGEELDRLQRSISLDRPEAIEQASQAIGSVQPYYLSYQGENDRTLQGIYGELLCSIQAARYPQWAKPLPMPVRKAGEPIRVGIVTGFFCRHVVWNLPLRGWVEGLDRDRFALYGYHTGMIRDEETDTARRCCVKFLENTYPVERLCEEIRRDNLHVLIYPEIGMSPLTAKLACLRLAPVQCTSWGIPQTSGLRTIDYFLSNELMETDDGKEHYLERLVRLPGLGTSYRMPEAPPPGPVDCRSLGIRPEASLYLCSQFLPKYLPQHDEVFPRITREVGNCQFLFRALPRAPHATRQFRERLIRVFAAHGLDGEQHVVILPYLNAPTYEGLHRISCTFLDSIGYSGCNTTLDAIRHDLPVATLPGRFFRGRMSLGILAMMGVTGTVAKDLDDYIGLAVRLGKDSEYRRSISDLYATNKHLLFNDPAPIRALEEFLEGTVDSMQ